MINQNSLYITKIELQKEIVKLLFECGEITQNQFNFVISKFDKKIRNLSKKEEDLDLKPICIEIKV